MAAPQALAIAHGGIRANPASDFLESREDYDWNYHANRLKPVSFHPAPCFFGAAR